MKIELSNTSGFCFGVRRGIKLAEGAATKGSRNVFCLGPIIHNPQVLSKLAAHGVQFVQEVPQASEGTVIIRCHGTTPPTLQEAKARGLGVIDATCPYVMRSQTVARSLKENGYAIVMVGEKDHPEMRSVKSFAENDAVIVETPEEAQGLPMSNKRVGILAQTTQSFDNFRAIVNVFLSRPDLLEVRAFNTICDDQHDRQRDAKTLAKSCDVVIVIGGRQSANSKRLYDQCREICPDSHFIETAAELLPAWLFQKRNIGIVSGASTPDWLIDEVVQRLQSIEEKEEVQA